jgi:nucleotide-binding universal stress UspA family protein
LIRMDAIKHIVCGVDFSEASEGALNAALDLAEKWDAILTILHAYQLPDFWFPDVTIPDKETLDAQVREGAERNLNALAERVAVRA